MNTEKSGQTLNEALNEILVQDLSTVGGEGVRDREWSCKFPAHKII